jgi:hypothetical protein
MINKSLTKRIVTSSLAVFAVMLIGGTAFEASAQRDPFAKAAWQRTKDPKAVAPGGKTATGPAVNLGLPSIESRIDYYKKVRETAALNGQSLPKVTSVLSLNEMSVTGIFKTPRGYAAMVEATPIKLSYTIYPGEKFFDGQLVAVEENRLVFRRVTKMSNGKFVSSVENKPLRKYTEREQIQGTAPVGAETASTGSQPVDTSVAPGAGAKEMIVSPLEEMNKQSTKVSEVSKPAKSNSKPVKVAKKSK